MKKVLVMTLTLIAAAMTLGLNPVSAVSNRVGKVTWAPVSEAHHYNIYYRENTETRYDHAVREIPDNMTSYTISHLRTDVAYTYRVAAVKADGTEFLWSVPKRLAARTNVSWNSGVKTQEAVVSKTYRQATVTWNGTEGAESYNIYYKKVGEAKWTHAVRDLPKESRSVTIKHLDKVAYVYQVVAVRGDKTEFSWSGVKKLQPTAVMRITVD